MDGPGGVWGCRTSGWQARVGDLGPEQILKGFRVLGLRV